VVKFKILLAPDIPEKMKLN